MQFRSGRFLTVKLSVGGNDQFIERLAVKRVDRNSGAYRKRRFFAVGAEPIGNTPRHQECGLGVGFGENQNKFVSTVTGGDVNFPGMKADNVGQAAKGATSYQMAVG